MKAGLAILVLGGSLAAVAACAPASAPQEQTIATVHVHQCGRCHSAPAPGSHPRDELADAFGRHQKRVHLSPDEWQAMIDYLAPRAN